MKNNKAVIYVRVSTQDQNDDRQKVDTENYIRINNLNLKETFIEKVSGYKIDYKKRDQFVELKEYVEYNNISHIVISELSRIGRRVVDTLAFIKECNDNKVCLHILKGGIKTLNSDGSVDTMFTMMISLLATMAQIESDQISYRVKSSLQALYKNEKGFNPRVFGYKRDEDGKAVIDEIEGPIVKEIFTLHQDNMSLFKITAYLNKKYEKKEEVKVFTEGGLRSILRNEIYTGKRSHNKGEHIIKVDSIISEEVFNKSLDLIKNRKRSSLDTVHINPFASILFCGLCESKLHQVVAPKYRTNKYVCSNKKCKLKPINRPHLIEVIKNELKNNINKDWFLKDKNKAIQNLEIENNSRNSLITELRKINNQDEALLTFLTDSTITREIYKTRHFKLLQKKETLSKRIEFINHEITNIKEFINSDSVNSDLKDLSQFKKVVQKHFQYIKITEEFAFFKIKGGFKHFVVIYRGSKLFQYNKGTLKNQTTRDEDISCLIELLKTNDNLDEEGLKNMLEAMGLEYLHNLAVDLSKMG